MAQHGALASGLYPIQFRWARTRPGMAIEMKNDHRNHMKLWDALEVSFVL